MKKTMAQIVNGIFLQQHTVKDRPCDRIGGTLKRVAGRASLQLPPHLQVLISIQLFQWSSQNLPNINSKLSAAQEYNAMKENSQLDIITENVS
ncbi:hypothetical protein PV325_010173 [Microctonus aethiopoides]|nr:hypothetical protein PV325_010173 [Microctonus aethiopoides]KAK0075320.1 hypothetical protein PV326_011683 [Microctonus aethiopoides]